MAAFSIGIPEVLPSYIKQQNEENGVRLSWKILDNVNSKTIVMTWKPCQDIAQRENQHGVSKPRYKKSASQLARDKQRKLDYEARIKSERSVHSETSGHSPSVVPPHGGQKRLENCTLNDGIKLADPENSSSPRELADPENSPKSEKRNIDAAPSHTKHQT